MSRRDEIVEEMQRVAKGLEREGLNDVQRARGRARYEALEEELEDIKRAERFAEEARKREEANMSEQEARRRELVENTWKFLDPTGKYKRRSAL